MASVYTLITVLITWTLIVVREDADRADHLHYGTRIPRIAIFMTGRGSQITIFITAEDPTDRIFITARGSPVRRCADCASFRLQVPASADPRPVEIKQRDPVP